MRAGTRQTGSPGRGRHRVVASGLATATIVALALWWGQPAAIIAGVLLSATFAAVIFADPRVGLASYGVNAAAGIVTTVLVVGVAVGTIGPSELDSDIRFYTGFMAFMAGFFAFLGAISVGLLLAVVADRLRSGPHR